jgi:hypothetical protein
MRQLAATACVLITVAHASVALAQGIAPRPSPGIIAGVVTDSAANPIPGAEVFYGDDRVRTVSGADGTFRFVRVRPGGYTITARRVGFVPQSFELTVGDSGATVRFSLVRIVGVLPAAVTTARQRGLTGIVTDSSFHPVVGAVVDALGGPGVVETDSAGRYHVDVDEGHFLLRVSKDGFRSASTTVTLKRDEGRDVSFRLIPDAAYSLVRERIAAMQMRVRVASRSPSRSRLLTRDDIVRTGARDLDDLVRRSGLVGSACTVTVDGWADRVPLWAVDIADIDYAELYENSGGSVDRVRPGSMPVTPTYGGCRVNVFVWLRR